VICLVPGVIVGVVVALVLVAVGLPLVGAVSFVVVAGGLSLSLWHVAPGAVVRSVGGRPSDEQEHPRLHNLVDGLCATMGLPRPTICVVESPVPNAMALGRDPATAWLIVTSGLDRCLSLVELEGVLAHELVHVKRHDTVVSGVAVIAALPWTLVGGIAKGSDKVHSLIGRGREFSADQRAAGVVRYPPGIRSALDVMVEQPAAGAPWPPGRGRTAALTRWLWIDPTIGLPASRPVEGNLDDTLVRAAALSLR
jgi:heat shock protein HtpX